MSCTWDGLSTSSIQSGLPPRNLTPDSCTNAPGSTVGADKGYDTARFVDEVRALEVTPHIAQKIRHSAIDGRTTRHPGYQVSQRKRKLVEQVFGWLKTVGGLRKLRHRGGALVDWIVTFAAAAYNLVRMRTLVVTCP